VTRYLLAGETGAACWCGDRWRITAADDGRVPQLAAIRTDGTTVQSHAEAANTWTAIGNLNTVAVLRGAQFVVGNPTTPVGSAIRLRRAGVYQATATWQPNLIFSLVSSEARVAVVNRTTGVYYVATMAAAGTTKPTVSSPSVIFSAAFGDEIESRFSNGEGGRGVSQFASPGLVVQELL